MHAGGGTNDRGETQPGGGGIHFQIVLNILGRHQKPTTPRIFYFFSISKIFTNMSPYTNPFNKVTLQNICASDSVQIKGGVPLKMDK